MDIYVDQKVEIGESKPPRRKLEGVEKYEHMLHMLNELENEEEVSALTAELDEVWWKELTEEQRQEIDPS